MRIIHDLKQIQKESQDLRRRNKKIGFVPTMGYLHEGHLSLVRQARKDNHRVIVSIFVNPLQFGPKEDFWRYPRNLVRDTELLRQEKVDILFIPSLKSFYEEDFQTTVALKKLTKPLCGSTRPGHFAGVTTVVLKLLNLTAPNTLYLGQKDYQQFRVIQQMLKDLSAPAKVKLMPILREADGLAMSSRNSLLSAGERKEAIFLSGALEKAKNLIDRGVYDVSKLKKSARDVLKLATHARMDYFEIVDADTLEAMVKLKTGNKALVSGAIFFSRTRLIDNILITV